MKEKRVNVSVANIYNEPGYKSETTTQALLFEKVSVEELKNNFSKITQEDGYSGWISNHQIVESAIELQHHQRVRQHFVKIHKEPDPESIQIRDAVIGSFLPVLDIFENWIKTVLPDGITGYVLSDAFGPFPDFDRSSVVSFAREFLGVPYFWGGRSAKGFDCSGFIQTIFNLSGANLPRDSWMQKRDSTFISDNYKDAQEGDLIFFGDDKKKVDHVGLYMGNSNVIHARGMVRINSLEEGNADFSEKLKNTIISINSIF